MEGVTIGVDSRSNRLTGWGHLMEAARLKSRPEQAGAHGAEARSGVAHPCSSSTGLLQTPTPSELGSHPANQLSVHVTESMHRPESHSKREIAGRSPADLLVNGSATDKDEAERTMRAGAARLYSSGTAIRRSSHDYFKEVLSIRHHEIPHTTYASPPSTTK
jgi:hypothetical protein